MGKIFSEIKVPCSMKITIAQFNPTVGDLEGNLEKITNTLVQCEKDESELLVLSELYLVGYPPRDMLERPSFIKKTQKKIEELQVISKKYPKTAILFGAPLLTGKATGRVLYNSALLIHQGKILFTQHKTLLPTYDVFDEARYFEPASEIDIFEFKGEVLGISICEDAWNDPQLWPIRTYDTNPIKILAEKGATVFINISASPFFLGKEEIRYRLVQNHAKKHRTPFIFVNQVGANDELIFDGRSMFIDKFGEPVEILPTFSEHVITVDTNASGTPGGYTPKEQIASIHDALILGVKDYLRKCGFSKAVIGLSGGIDSAVTAYIAKEALGPENVLGITMPGPYSSDGSVDDSIKLADNLGIEIKKIDISKEYNTYIDSLKDHFSGKESDEAEENIQARVRGNILMAISNKFGHLVLSTGNKSELAVGYCTLYGDMTGGLAVISDVPKTMVYELARYVNRGNEIIPNETIEKPPSAELKPDQMDQDTLPPYELLDQILQYYVDDHLSADEIIAKKFDPGVVEWIVKAVNRNEYKRRQAAPGLKVTSKAFGVGRRMPIAAKYDF
jgi:NAD+ synthase (glutamine-hydrolysing)